MMYFILSGRNLFSLNLVVEISVLFAFDTPKELNCFTPAPFKLVSA